VRFISPYMLWFVSDLFDHDFVVVCVWCMYSLSAFYFSLLVSFGFA